MGPEKMTGGGYCMDEASWRRQAKAAAYAYPRLEAALRDLRATGVTSRLSGAPGRGGDSRAVEDAALRELPPEDQAVYDAVTAALALMSRLNSPGRRKRLADLVYFRRTHTLYGAAAVLEVSAETARRWNADFLLLLYGQLRKVRA